VDVIGEVLGGVMLGLSLLPCRTGEAWVEEDRTRLRGEGDLGEGEGEGSMKAVVVCRDPARVSRSRDLGDRGWGGAGYAT
jgi:hypothetical protein